MSSGSLNILMASPEAVPFVKTGGLADVAGALPYALAGMGHTVKVAVPLYKAVDRQKFNLVPMPNLPDDLSITIGDDKHNVKVYVWKSRDYDVEFWFIDNEYFFDRNGIYIDPVLGKDYPDNDERYAFYSRAALEVAKAAEFKPHIVHAHDWQAGMICGYLATIYKQDPFFENSRSVFTIHNIGYQGHFPGENYWKLGLPAHLYTPGSPFEYWDHINFLKVGITTSDIISTVSPTYAMEIQSGNEMGFGMEGILFYRRGDLYGVLNGVDYSLWSPEQDELIPYSYSSTTLDNKERNKHALLNQAGLTSGGKRVPLIGIISRLADQKGFDLIEQITDRLFMKDIRLILLGTGDEKYHDLFESLMEIYPTKVKAFLKFDNKLAHMIEAGSDIFLMPSRYEPCGLNQMYSLRYGTVPIVRKTGGLADTIIDYDENPDDGNGFVFEAYDPDQLFDAVERALAAYQDARKWKEILLRGMGADFSWDASAREYQKIYNIALQKEPAERAFNTPLGE